MIDFSPIPFTSIGIEINNICQLNCSYCWEKQNPQSPNKKELSLSQMQELVNFVIKSKDSWKGWEDTTLIIFCAKEPLLSWNLIKQIWENNKKELIRRNILFKIMTNGVALSEEIIQYCVKNHFMVNISLDGPSTHDKDRVFYNGQPSFHRIQENLKKIPIKESGLFALGMTISPKSIRNFCEDVITLLTLNPNLLLGIGTVNSDFEEKDWLALLSEARNLKKILPKRTLKRICFKNYIYDDSLYNLSTTFNIYVENDFRVHIMYPIMTAIIREMSPEEEWIFNGELSAARIEAYQKKYSDRFNFESTICSSDCPIFGYCKQGKTSFEVSEKECLAMRFSYLIWRELNGNN